jgi:hypothetical protein
MPTEVPSLQTVLGLGQGPQTKEGLPTTFVKRRAIEVLQELFSGREDYPWRTDSSKTGVRILDVFSYNLKDPEPKPALIVRRGNVAWRYLTLNQLEGTWGRAEAALKRDAVRCDMTIFCVSRLGLEAEFLADVVFFGMTSFEDQIRELKDVIDVSPKSIGSEVLAKADAGPIVSVVPVLVEWQFQRRWVVLPQMAEPHRAIGVTVNSQ